ncbi:predicted protein [Pyrenophora tritici-repentis Pt-1C-BFP]|uniref:Uncharacterized protein n=1 Tax=Pyrenophora tritici-repentis (strain Pt-1C-BFP) TaxID=426418 RepID=B2W2R0_PYRTR|nr:uncharacterized protein PTRG_03708 [Pyrenophora tritici-repentis Pt-1C-BFP]EDU46546.1 predicted protein [Pyrenophora tritici-repentis Pt-1C-BFP]
MDNDRSAGRATLRIGPTEVVPWPEERFLFVIFGPTTAVRGTWDQVGTAGIAGFMMRVLRLWRDYGEKMGNGGTANLFLPRTPLPGLSNMCNLALALFALGSCVVLTQML